MPLTQIDPSMIPTDAIDASKIAAKAVTQPKVGDGVGGKGPAFSAYQSSAQTLSSSVTTKLNFQTEEFDTDSCYDPATGRFTPNVAGYYRVTGGVQYNSGSDARLKTNIADAPSALSLVNDLRVRSYDWLASKNHDDYGFIAQELHQVYPSAVSAQADKEDGSMDMPWGVDYAKLVPVLTKAIQEQQALITTLTERITALEAK